MEENATPTASRQTNSAEYPGVCRNSFTKIRTKPPFLLGNGPCPRRGQGPFSRLKTVQLDRKNRTRSTVSSSRTLYGLGAISVTIPALVGVRLPCSITFSVINVPTMVHGTSVAICNLCLTALRASLCGNFAALASCTGRVYACTFNVFRITCIPRMGAGCLGFCATLFRSKNYRRESKNDGKCKNNTSYLLDCFIHFILLFCDNLLITCWLGRN